MLAGFVLAAAVLQLIAAVLLELASPRALAIAHARGAQWFYILLGVLVVGILGARLLKDRPGPAFAFGAGTIGLGLAYVRTKVGLLNLALHAEPTAFHFVAITSAAMVGLLALRWQRHPTLREQLGRRRHLPAAVAGAAVLLLSLEHLGEVLGAWKQLESSLGRDTLRGAARLCALSTWPLATWLFWRHLQDHSARWVPLLVTALLVTRVVAAGPRGLVGATVVDGGATVLGATFVVVALATAVTVRPRVELIIHGIVGLASLGACMLFLWLYYRAYGNIEDGLGDILRSLFAFDVPLPYGQHPGWWKPAVVMVGVFFLLYTTYAAIVSAPTRPRGVALALMALAGMNLASPYLVLLLASGGMLFVDSLLMPPGYRDATSKVSRDATRREPSELPQRLEALAERLAFDAPLSVDAGRAKLWALSGSLDEVAVDLRVRVGGRDRRIELTCGVLGQHDPVLSLLYDPGDHGQRPAHPAAADYRVEGELRHLELLGDRPLDALSALRNANMRCWDAGVLIELDRDDPALSVDRLEALVRAAAKAARP